MISILKQIIENRIAELKEDIRLKEAEIELLDAEMSKAGRVAQVEDGGQASGEQFKPGPVPTVKRRHYRISKATREKMRAAALKRHAEARKAQKGRKVA